MLPFLLTAKYQNAGKQIFMNEVMLDLELFKNGITSTILVFQINVDVNQLIKQKWLLF